MNTFYKEGVTFNFVKITDNVECRNWMISNFHIWEPFTFECFRKVSNSSKIAIDIGAWIGLTAIWLAKHFKHVICIEADKISTENLRLNLIASNCDNFSIYENAFYNEKTNLCFGSNSFKSNSTLNESMSQIKFNSDKKDDYIVDTITLSEIIKGIPISDIGLLKIDIEGGEEFIMEDVMNFCSKNNIPILLSFHINWWKDKNFNRFINLFKNFNIISDQNKNIMFEELFECLSSNPFVTLFCTYNITL